MKPRFSKVSSPENENDVSFVSNKEKEKGRMEMEEKRDSVISSVKP